MPKIRKHRNTDKGPPKSEYKKAPKPPGRIQTYLAGRFKLFRKFRSWWVGGKSVTRSIFRVTAAWQGVVIIGVVLVACYVMAAFYTGAGEFVIRLDHAGQDALVLSNTPDFSDPKVLLKGHAIDNADNISIFDIEPDVANVDGEHYGANYIAYTFYVKNISRDQRTYDYNFSIRHSTKGIDKAIWTMLYYNGTQNMYAAPNLTTGNPEIQISDYDFPFQDAAASPQQTQLADGSYQLSTTPFKSTKVITSGTREAIQPEEVDKYTIVCWLEGEDPECVDDILGGTIELLFRMNY